MFTVIASTLDGRPARIDAWRAGDWPREAERTLPK